MQLSFISKMTPLLGLDLGSSRTRLWTAEDGVVLDEATALAVDTRSHKVIAVGQEAQAMAGRVNPAVTLFHPVQGGRLYDSQTAQALLKVFFQKVLKSNYFLRPIIMVSVAADSTEADRLALSSLLYGVGAREVYTISQPLAAAIGAGVPIADASGSFIVHLGSGVVEGAVISLGSLVRSESTLLAGSQMDIRIQQALKQRAELLVSLEMAERLKKTVASIDPSLHREALTTGQDMAVSSPKEVKVTSAMLLPTLTDVVKQYQKVLQRLLSHMPPELTVDVIDKGMLLSGGLAQLAGLDQHLVRHLGIPVSVVENPDRAVIKGIGTALEHLDLFKESLGYRV
jgi:rod shape-determining protein MreB